MDGSPSEDMIAFYEARAVGGAGLIIPEIARVNDVHGAGMMRQLSVSKDRPYEVCFQKIRHTRLHVYWYKVKGTAAANIHGLHEVPRHHIPLSLRGHHLQ